jgi:hypothetical protein
VRCYRESEKEAMDRDLKDGLKTLVGLVQQIYEIATGQAVGKWDELVGLLQ